ncbi:MAG: terpene cyclase/mutase family protein [Planctomycetes bacterium]|nr:terpene cyclase/mutase family protein [Planctomycetota bacterium]
MSMRALLLLCFSAATARAGEVTQQRIDAAIEKGVQHLLRQYADGFGRGRAGPPVGPELVDRVGLRALTAYTLVKSGVSPKHGVVERLIARLSFDASGGTYDRACTLLALQAIDAAGSRDWIAELARELVESQERAGDWGYPGGGDLSNTQYAALGLRAAQVSGVDVPPRVWSRLARAVLAYRTGDGGFGYAAGAREATGSMTTAGIGVLAICETELARARMLDGELERELPRARAAGWRWLDEHFSVETNPPGGPWLHYYLYGLERAGALAGVERIGDHGWYTEGARVLLDTQDGAGEWHGTFEREGTLFALLFLRRATHAHAPRTVEPGETRVEQRGTIVAGPVWFSAEGEGPVNLTIEGFAPEVRARFGWPEDGTGGPRVVRVEYLASETPIAVVLGDASRACGAQRFECVCATLPPGKQSLRARVLVRAPPAQRDKEPKRAKDDDEDELGPVRVINSSVVVVDVRNALPPRASLETPRAKTLGGLAANASSSFKKALGFEFTDFGARSAVDGNRRTPWIADPKDKHPVLRIQAREPAKVERVRVLPPRIAPSTPARLVLPAEIDVVVHPGPPRRLALDANGGELVFERPVDLRVLELRIVSTPTGEQLYGIGEVELRVP